MAFNENQFFYAALWWLAALPGGKTHTANICARHGKTSIDFPQFDITRKPQKWKAGAEDLSPQTPEDVVNLMLNALGVSEQAREFNREAAQAIEAPLPAQTLDVFFDSLFEALKNKTDFQHTAERRQEGRFIELRQSAAISSLHPAYPDHPFSDDIETAIAKAGIDRGALPQSTGIILHDDGQMFVPQAQQGKPQWLMDTLNYPGKPDLPYQHLALQAKDMNHCPRLTWELLYRVVPLQAGQAFKTGWMTVSGSRTENEDIAGEDQVLVIGNSDVENPELLETLTDEQIINFHPSIKRSMAARRKEYQEGYEDRAYNMSVEAADQPNIMRKLIADIAYIKVKAPVQIGHGLSYAIAQPGDFIIRESERSAPRVIRKSSIDQGAVRFIVPPQDAAKPYPGLH
ncbi:MAG: hypothetical protein H6867_06060 [Rhodospirillales bacterium]|nr:hypothetical protein [Rhodospirillales bacterium]MCB9995093.1 hypothetical protein [Rhodospirillales bacterium]